MNGEQIAQMVALHYVNDAIPGISRKMQGKTFIYFNPDGTRVVDEVILTRIRSLAIPPAYSQVWISPYDNGHIQAIGRDSKNRKQYRYHPRWREISQQNKFMSMISFGKALPAIREHIQNALNQSLDLNKKQVICAIIYLLDNYYIRIGNYVYEKQNKSYGLTTLRKKHLSLSATKAILHFEGKSSQLWHIVLKDKKILKILKKCEDMPGYRLFKYLDEDNTSHEISSQEVNDYLYEIAKSPITAKDFRTWAACREMLARLIEINHDDEVTSQAILKEVFSDVATLLGHTPAICQKCYVYPKIIATWKNKQLISWYKKSSGKIAADKDKLLLLWLKKFFDSEL